MNALVLIKDDGQRYLFLYDDDSIAECLRALGRAAADPELNFTWHDAAILSQGCRRRNAGAD